MINQKKDFPNIRSEEIILITVVESIEFIYNVSICAICQGYVTVTL